MNPRAANNNGFRGHQMTTAAVPETPGHTAVPLVASGGLRNFSIIRREASDQLTAFCGASVRGICSVATRDVRALGSLDLPFGFAQGFGKIGFRQRAPFLPCPE